MNHTRNTVEATSTAAQNKLHRRRETILRIKEEVFSIRCVCSDQRCKNGDFSNICMSNKGLAKLLNELKIPTVSGKDHWHTTQVSRLFPRQTTRSLNTNSKGKTSLSGLI